jgi:pyridoxal phosphate enzyme (YggS family)
VEQHQLRSRIADNFGRIRAQIDNASQGRQVTLVCVTKYAELPSVEALLEAGATALGENRLPAGGERFEALRAAGYHFDRHLLGPPQSRKLKLVPGSFDMLQALDGMDSAEQLSALCVAAVETLDVLLQVNIGAEPQKHGLTPAELDAASETVASRCPGLSLRGLMAIPPGPAFYGSAIEFERGTRECFRQMRGLFDRISAQRHSPQWDTLSLGMSHDYSWAIAEGATMVRIGSALFEGV